MGGNTKLGGARTSLFPGLGGPPVTMPGAVIDSLSRVQGGAMLIQEPTEEVRRDSRSDPRPAL